MHESEKTSLRTSAKIKLELALSEPTHHTTRYFQTHQLSTKENTLFRIIFHSSFYWYQTTRVHQTKERHITENTYIYIETQR